MAVDRADGAGRYPRRGVAQIEPEQDGPCRDINFDPTVLPSVSARRRPVSGGTVSLSQVIRPAHRRGKKSRFHTVRPVRCAIRVMATVFARLEKAPCTALMCGFAS